MNRPRGGWTTHRRQTGGGRQCKSYTSVQVSHRVRSTVIESRRGQSWCRHDNLQGLTPLNINMQNPHVQLRSSRSGESVEWAQPSREVCVDSGKEHHLLETVEQHTSKYGSLVLKHLIQNLGRKMTNTTAVLPSWKYLPQSQTEMNLES